MAPFPSNILLNGHPVLDVRSPSEFTQGHFPGAFSLPLFSDEERHTIGLTYKEQDQHEAIKTGLEMVGPKMRGFVEAAENIAPEGEVNMYCWRGGMRSGSMAWLLRTSGFKVNLIEGGYKAWRKEALQTIAAPYSYYNLSGFTGVGKTEILYALKERGEQVIDLEGFANHKGSAFVDKNQEQPSSEHFENKLAHALLSMDKEDVIWIEDESRSIGKVFMNPLFYKRLVSAPMILVNRPMDDRVDYLCNQYGTDDVELLIEGFERIRKRIGGQHATAAIEYLKQNKLDAASRIAIRYYDKAYMHSMSKLGREPIFSVHLKNSSYDEVAKKLIAWKHKQNEKTFA